MDRCRAPCRRYGHSVKGTEQGVAGLLDAYLDAAAPAPA